MAVIFVPIFLRVCVGRNEFGRPIHKVLKPKAYFRTYAEAYEPLIEYRKNSLLTKMLSREWLGTKSKILQNPHILNVILNGLEKTLKRFVKKRAPA